MRVTDIQLHRFRSFSNMEPIALDQINVLIGPNNSGKSSILKALQLMQEGYGDFQADLRVGSQTAVIKVGLSEMSGEFQFEKSGTLQMEIVPQPGSTLSLKLDMSIHMPMSRPNSTKQLSDSAPNHFIVPFLSKRKTSHYREDVKEEQVSRVHADMSNLAAKLLHVAHPGYPEFEKYRDACLAILGFVVAATPSKNGLNRPRFTRHSPAS